MPLPLSTLQTGVACSLLPLGVLLLHRALQQAVVCVGSRAKAGDNVHISGGLKARDDNGADLLCLSVKSSTVRELHVRLARLKADSNPSAVVTKVSVALFDTSGS